LIITKGGEAIMASPPFFVTVDVDYFTAEVRLAGPQQKNKFGIGNLTAKGAKNAK